MSDKKLTREEYARLTKENMEIFAKLDKQIAMERQREDEFLCSLSEEDQVEYLLKKDIKSNIAAADKFKSSCKTVDDGKQND